jgi:group I intron endonuclease
MKDYFKQCTINLEVLCTSNEGELPDWVFWDWCIYKITNLNNHKVYIGQAKDFYTRLVGRSYTQYSHYNDYKKSLINGTDKRLYGALIKWGLNQFEVSIIDESNEMTQEELDSLEIYYIELYDSTNPDKGYNMSKGGLSGGIEYMSSSECRAKAVPKIIKTNTLNGNGDCMYMCHTPEIQAKIRETIKMKYNGDSMGQCHTPEASAKAVYNSSITQCINNILSKIKMLSDAGLPLNPYNYYWNTGNDEYHLARDSRSHIDSVCNHLYDEISIELDPRWTDEMSRLFHWFDSFSDYTLMESEMSENMIY